MIYSIQFLVFNFLNADFLVPKSGYHCENKAVLGTFLLKKVQIPLQHSIWSFAHCNVSEWVMMIKKSLHLILVLLQNLELWKRRRFFLESFSLFNELSVVAWLIVLILVKKFPVMRESRDYFAVTLDLFQLFV